LVTFNFNLQLFAEAEKTEPATPRKREEARKKGQVAKSADVNAAAVLLVLVIYLYTSRASLLEGVAELFRSLEDHFFWELTGQNLGAVITGTLLTFVQMVLPVFLAAMAVGLAANLAQVGFLFAPEVIKPSLQKINPVEGFKRIFSRRALMELFKALVKVAAVGAVGYLIVRGGLEELLATLFMGSWQTFEVISGLLFRLALAAGGVFAALAAVDFLFQRWDFNENLKMTKQEVKEEFKQTEGDPQVKARLRQLQRQMAQHRMMAQVPEATVVVTNPVHLAVALRYQPEADKAPKVVAKGAGAVAERIKILAKQHRVPVLENKPLARMLFQTVELDEEIPAELYQAVAEVLAFVYSLGRKPDQGKER